MAKVDSYQKDGETKGKYVEIGVILSNENGEYALINPGVNLAGVMMQQRINLNQTKGSSVMCSIFDNDNQQSNNNQPAQQESSVGASFDKEIPFIDPYKFTSLIV